MIINEIKYKCSWCGYLLNENREIVKMDNCEYCDLELVYCVDCYKIVVEELKI